MEKARNRSYFYEVVLIVIVFCIGIFAGYRLSAFELSTRLDFLEIENESLILKLSLRCEWPRNS